MRFVIVTMLACAAGAGTSSAAESAWNGAWTLDAGRSSAGAKENAADGYTFALGTDGAIRWESPSLHEVVTVYTDGQPMAIHRSQSKPGLTLAVTPNGPFELHYEVARNGQPAGGGIMHIIKGGKAWVDISWQAGKEDLPVNLSTRASSRHEGRGPAGAIRQPEADYSQQIPTWDLC